MLSKSRLNFSLLTIAVAVTLGCGSVVESQAFPSFYSSRCASCHSDDTASCNGCHHHQWPVNAVADQTEYAPGVIAGLVSVSIRLASVSPFPVATT